MTLIGVVYRSEPETLYPDMIQLLDFGFDNFKMVDLGMKAGDVVGEAAVKEGKRGKIDVTVKSDVKATVELMEGQKFSDDPSDYDCKIESDQLTAPVKKGEKAGRMVVYRGDSAVAQLDVYAAEDMEKTAVGGLLPKAVIIAALIAVLAGALFILRKIWRRKTC